MTRLRSDWQRNLGVLLGTSLLLLLLIEFVGRLLVAPSELSYGRLLGIELPPHVLPSPFFVPQSVDRSERYKGLVIDGREITIGDLWGLTRPDARLGHAPPESTSSVNGWWKSNDLGARSPVED